MSWAVAAPIFHPESTVGLYGRELKATEAAVSKEFGLAPFLPGSDPFCSDQELLARSRIWMRRARTRDRQSGAVFSVRIGGKLIALACTRASYDDWSSASSWATPVTNGDITIIGTVLEDAFELSSMGIRVADADTLMRQLALTGDEDRLQLEWHQALLRGEMPPDHRRRDWAVASDDVAAAIAAYWSGAVRRMARAGSRHSCYFISR